MLNYTHSNVKGEINMTARKPGGRPSKKPNAEMLSMLYENMTAREIAEQYGVSLSTVRRWIRDCRAEERGE